MTSGEVTPAWSPLPSPIPPSPSPPESECKKGVPNSQFAGLGKEVLLINNVPISRDHSRAILLPIRKSEDHLPGQPRIRLSQPQQTVDKDKDPLLQYLRLYHLTEELDGLLPFMKFIFVQTPSYAHIRPLHQQEAHERKIIINEKPGLHLVWYYDRIFIKPIPAYFFSPEFWVYIRKAAEPVHRAAVGFMRSYYYLIQFQLDYDQAIDKKLIPKLPDGSDRHPTYKEFVRFVEQFNEVKDEEICRRYHYGELRLTRINRVATIFKGELAYFHIHPQWGSYLRHFFAPIIMILGGCSVIMNGMQVNLNAQEMIADAKNGPAGLSSSWARFVSFSLYFPAIIITMIAGVVGIAGTGALGMAIGDLLRARKIRRERKKGNFVPPSRSHGMI